jgi:hypothetical protein
MMFFGGCFFLLFAAGQVWPSVWRNATAADVALALSVVGVLCGLVGLYPILKRIYGRLYAS